MPTSSLIRKSYSLTIDRDMMNELRCEDMVADLIAYNQNLGGVGFLTPLGYYLDLLKNTQKVMFAFMTEEKKEELLRQLQVTCLLLLAQKRHESTHQKTENIQFYEYYIAKCQKLIDALGYQKYCKEEQIIPVETNECATDGYPIKYLFIELGIWFGEKIEEMASRKTKTIKEAMGWFNEKRLYWVWESGLLIKALELVPADFFNVGNAAKAVQAPAPYTGAISWGLYYFRGSLNLFLLLKHTIKGSWMSEEESNIPWTERFLTQWNQRKFTLLNDFVWATGNCLCYFILTGSGALGTWGDVLTLALLAFDIGLAVWEYEENKTQFLNEMLHYEEDIKAIKQRIKQINNDPDATETEKKKLKEYRLQLQCLEKAQKQCQKDWDYQNISLRINIGYAVGLMLAFALVALPFLPITGAALVTLSVTGTVICFVLTVLNNAAKGGMELYKSYQSKKEAQLEYEAKVAEFHDLVLTNPDLEDNQKKMLFLEIKKTLAETDYQMQIVVFQSLHLVRSLIIETLMPALIFTSLVFLPLSTGLVVLGAALVLAIYTNSLIDDLYNPEQAKIKHFDEEEYKTFCTDPDNWGKKSVPKAPQFFKPEPKPEDLSAESKYDIEEENHSFLEPKPGPCAGLA
ncbi:DUF1542 domain-containing protein [Legionella worsleiensis]|uniref:Coiled-coil protein n=1 Tax=Legionella worsleiensis TaxID=45076 RepID=A0A0W1AEN4_9GAMM|nr:DUF1542 domain-containing protein [Legionella worsleiensis]KTD79786.1 hypothetical protein Lwor_1300 [Legionella worsleiensis]STY32297.1 Uncharacterised protein [Legionella worsleiensis]